MRLITYALLFNTKRLHIAFFDVKKQIFVPTWNKIVCFIPKSKHILWSMEQSRAKILVIDDTKTNIEVLEGILSNDYDIFVALNGKKALVLAEKVKPDLILLDVMMPEMDGYETLRQMHAQNLVENTPVLFLTAKADAKSEQMGLDLGAVDYITKPFNPDLVRLRIKNQLEFKHQRDHLHELVEEKTQDLRKTLKVLLTSLGALAEYRDPETGEHIKRTQVLVQMLAETLQKNPKFKQQIPNKMYVDFFATAAPLHDIGKVGISDDILRKPAKLNDEERAIMSNHAQMGFDVLVNATKELSNHPLVKICAEIILNHHERWDGLGYPRGIKGSEIPVGARLMSVADVYDALVSRRPYKEPLPHEVAVSEIFAGKGSQFDPDVVDAFMEIESSLPDLYDKFRDSAQ